MVLRRRTLSQLAIPERWLFVCAMNFERSPTAEHVARAAGYWADSCGTDVGAGKSLTLERIKWADVIVCMRERHAEAVRRIAPDLLQERRLFTWGIEAGAPYMDRGLLEICRRKLKETTEKLNAMDEARQENDGY